MKNQQKLAGGVLLLAAGLSLPTQADEQLLPGPYFQGDMGGALTGDTALKEFPGTGGSSKVSFDPGVRLSLGGGWRFADWFRAGGEFGIIGHNLDGADANFNQFPILANVEFQLPNRTHLVPFIGGGPGLSISTIWFDFDNLNGGDFVDGGASDAVFAWQVYGGVRYQLNEGISIGVVYKYFEAGETSWDVGDSASEIRFGKTQTHAISVSFSMDF